MKQYKLTIKTPGRGLLDITKQIAELVTESSVTLGLCHVFIRHTSASLCISENYDPLVLSDMEAFMQRLIPDGDPLFLHTEEGPDDMPSHIRAVLTSTFLQIPITDKQLDLGRYQAIYLWEHRLRSYDRQLVITIQG